MTTVYLNANSDETPANTSVQWNNIGGSESGTALVDSANDATTWTVNTSFPVWNNVDITGISPTTGDAAWIDETAVLQDGGYATSQVTYETITVNVPDDATAYNIDFFGAVNAASGNRTLEVRVNGGTAQTLITGGNSSNILSFSNVANNSGVLLIEIRRAAGISGNSYFQAVRVAEFAPAPSLSIDTTLEPGGAFVLTYSDYPGVPVSPITIIDAQGNEDTVAVTVSDNGDGSGTASGTMPALPSSGSEQSVLFGAVTVRLSV